MSWDDPADCVCESCGALFDPLEVGEVVKSRDGGLRGIGALCDDCIDAELLEHVKPCRECGMEYHEDDLRFGRCRECDAADGDEDDDECDCDVRPECCDD